MTEESWVNHGEQLVHRLIPRGCAQMVSLSSRGSTQCLTFTSRKRMGCFHQLSSASTWYILSGNQPWKVHHFAGKSQCHVGPVTINVASIWITINGGPTKRLLNMVTNVALRSVVEPNHHSSEVVGSSCLDETQPFPLVKLFFGATILPRGWFLSPKHYHYIS